MGCSNNVLTFKAIFKLGANVNGINVIIAV